MFNDIIDSKPTVDLTPYLASQPEESFPGYQQLKLSSETVITEGNTYDATYELEAKYPEAWYKEADGSYCRTGYADSTIEERLSDGNIPYYAGGPLKAYEVKVPDCVFCLSYLAFPGLPTTNRGNMKRGETAPYIGDGRTLNSTIDGVPVESSVEDATASDDDVVANNPDQKPILALCNIVLIMRSGPIMIYWVNGDIPCYTMALLEFLRNSIGSSITCFGTLCIRFLLIYCSQTL